MDTSSNDNRELKTFSTVLLIISIVFVFVTVAFLSVTRFDHPKEFYRNYSDLSETEGRIHILRKIRCFCAKSKFDDLLRADIMQQYDPVAFATALKITEEGYPVENIDTLSALSKNYYFNIPDGFSWTRVGALTSQQCNPNAFINEYYNANGKINEIK